MRDLDATGSGRFILKGILHTDGGSRGNPGESGIGYVLETDDIEGNRQLVSYGGWYLGHATNNQAEYHALIWGLENALVLDVRTIEIELDSELIVKQLNGQYKVKNANIQALYQLAVELLGQFYKTSISHVGRELNNESDKLANAAMDHRTAVGGFHVEYVEPEQLAADEVEFSSPVIGAAAAAVIDASGADAAADFAASDASGAAATADPAATIADPTVEDTSAAAVSNLPKQTAFDFEKPLANTERQADMATKGTYYLKVKEHFDAAHALIGYDGECKNLHGHTWDVEVEVKGTELDVVGIVYDFKDLKENLKEILSQFDHKYLNEVPPFNSFNATAENLARVVYEQMIDKLPASVSVYEVSVWESPIARLVYKVE